MAEMLTVDFQNSFIFVLISLFSLLCYFFIFKKPKNSRKLGHGCDLPPSPPSLPIIGHLHLILSGLIHKSLQKLSSKYGPFLYLRIFNAPVVIVSSASVAYEFFKTHDLNLSFRGDSPFGESLLVGCYGFVNAPYGEYYIFMKKLVVTNLLGSSALDRSRGVRADELERFYKNLLDKAMKKERVQIGKEAMKLTNNSICKMVMGRSCSEENGEAERLRSLVNESIALTKKIFVENVLHKPLKMLGISLFKNKIMNLSCRYDEVLERIIKEHEEKLEEHPETTDMVDLLLAVQRDENAEYKITRNHIKSLIVDLLIGGTDTSRHVTQWILAEIINNPKILERLREEIDSVVGKTRLIQEMDLPNLPYLQAVVKEGLRMYPSGSIFARSCEEGFKMGGFYVPEKSRFIVNAYAVMRDPDYWENPNEFKPERFVTSSREEMYGTKEQALKYIPFGGGRRGCPGANLSYIFVETAIGTMVQCFDWRINGDKVDLEESVLGTNMAMAHPLICTPIPRIDPLTFNLEISSS